jgi:hypothetical protein
MVALIQLLLSAPLWAVEPVGNMEAVRFIRAIDGDELELARPGIQTETYWEPAWLHFDMELLGVSCAELDSGLSVAFRAALFSAETLGQAEEIYIQCDDYHPLVGYGGFGYWVWYRGEDGELHLLNLELIKAGLGLMRPTARPYRYELLDAAMAAQGL